MHKAEEYSIYKDAGIKDENMIFIEGNKNLAHKYAPGNCKVYACLVSDKEEMVDFHITNNGQSSSILNLKDHSLIYPHIVNIETRKIKATTLDNILKHSKINKNDWNILNLDIQGAELKAMKGLSEWDNVDAVFTEVNYREMYENCCLIGDIVDFLNERGLIKVEENDTGAGWGDALFIKK